jgi:hypothetical protein
MEGPDVVKRCAYRGGSRLIVPVMALGAPPVEAVERFANEWLPKIG